MQWHSNNGFLKNIENIVEEYKYHRNLKSLKIIILGPPASGKTRLAKLLANYYQIHYISVESLISETLDELVKLYFS